MGKKKSDGEVWFRLSKMEPVLRIHTPVKKKKYKDEPSKEEETGMFIELPEEIGLSGLEGPLTIGRGTRSMLYIYGRDQWEALCETLKKNEKISGMEEKNRGMLVRYFLGGAYETEIDEHGLFLPEELAEQYGIREEAVLLKFESGGEAYYAVRNAEE